MGERRGGAIYTVGRGGLPYSSWVQPRYFSAFSVSKKPNLSRSFLKGICGCGSGVSRSALARSEKGRTLG